MKILVPVDGSDNSLLAVKYADDVAKRYDDAVVTLLYVIVSEPVYIDSGEPAIDPKLLYADLRETIEKAERETADNALAAAAEACHSITPDTLVESASGIADKIVDVAENGGYDMIVMGSRGLSNIKRFLMGSVSTKVIQCAHCTVSIVR